MKKISSKTLLVISVLTAFVIVVGSVAGLIILNNVNNSANSNFISGEIQNFEVELDVKDPISSETKKYDLNAIPGENVLSFMQDLQQQDKNFQFTFSQSQYGTFIESINGYTPNLDNKEFWKLFVNGVAFQGGATDYILKGGDKISWEVDTVQD